MSDVKNSIKNLTYSNNINVDGFSDNVDNNFAEVLKLLISNWVSNGQFTISISSIPNDITKVKFSTFKIDPTTKKASTEDVKYFFSEHVNSNVNSNSEVKKLGQFKVDTTNSELGFIPVSTTQVDWKNYPCVINTLDKKEVKTTDGTITYEISGYTYYGNGTRKDKSGNVTNYVCSDDKKTIMSASTSYTTSGGGTSTNNGSTTLVSGKDAIAQQLINVGAGGSVSSTVKAAKNVEQVAESTTILEQVIRIKKLMKL